MGSPLGPIWEVDPDDWWRTMEVNLRSVVLASHAVLPGMMARRRGRIINVSSLAASYRDSLWLRLCEQQTAMIRLSETMALETKSAMVFSVFTIHPGLVRTAMAEMASESPEGQAVVALVSHAF